MSLGVDIPTKPPSRESIKVTRWVWVGLAVLLLASLFASLGFWQLDRHRQRTALNDAVTAARMAEPVPLRNLCDRACRPSADKAYRQVTAAGTYDSDHQILVRHQVVDKQTGMYVLTPLRLSEGGILLVVRGWIPPAAGGAATEPHVATPSRGVVNVTARIRLPQEGVTSGATTITQIGKYPSVVAIQPEKLGDALGLEGVVPLYAELIDQAPRSAEGLTLAQAPTVDPGPHLSYAVQWFLFATCAIGAYVFLLVRAIRGKP